MGKQDSRRQDSVHSFVALGDSFTEGLNDYGPGGELVGWADRVAQVLAAQVTGFRYANLAVRGNLVRHVVDGQIEGAVALAPDLVSVAAGGNDILRGADVDKLAGQFDSGIARLRAAGCQVLIFTGFDPVAFPVIRLLRGRVAAYNMNLRAIADERGCAVVDLWSMRILRDPRAWSADRLHLTSQGHQRVALRTCSALGLPVEEDWRGPFSAEHDAVAAGPGAFGTAAGTWFSARRQDARWAREFAMPWFNRRIRGTSSGDGRLPKRPELLPVTL